MSCEFFYAAGVDDGDVFADFGDACGGAEIRALEGAVAGDVGVDDGGEGPVVDIAGDIDGFGKVVGSLGPAVGGDETVAGVEAEDEPVAEAGVVSHGFKPLHLGEGAGAEDEALGADGEDVFHGLFGANAAADFDLKIGGA